MSALVSTSLVPYRLLVPLVDEVHEVAVQEEEDVDYGEHVVGVPEGVETSEAAERAGQLENASPKVVASKHEGDGHEEDHGHTGKSLHTLEKVRVRGLLVVEVVRDEGELLRRCADKAGEVAKQVVAHV